MLTIFGDYVYQYDIASLIYMIVLMWLFLKFKNFPLETNKYFVYLLISAMVANVFDLLSCVVINYRDQVPSSVNYIVQILYYVPNFLCIVFYSLMTLSITKPYQKVNLTAGPHYLVIIV